MPLPRILNNAGQWIDAVFVAMAGGDGVNAASPSNPASVAGPPSIAATQTMTRPADTTAYSVGDLIANNTAAASVTPLAIAIARANDAPVLLRRARIKANNAAWKGAVVRLHLFKNAPTVTVGDNGQLNNAETYAFTESLYLGYVDVTLAIATSDGWAKGFADINCIAEPATGTVNIYGLLEARSAVTPTSGGQIAVTLEALRD